LGFRNLGNGLFPERFIIVFSHFEDIHRTDGNAGAATVTPIGIDADEIIS